MAGKLVLVAGNIGTGKTSLTERLGERLGWRTAYESVIDNPYLGDFYQNMDAWSFHLQIYFLGHRAQQHLELGSENHSAIADRSIYEDVKDLCPGTIPAGQSLGTGLPLLPTGFQIDR